MMKAKCAVCRQKLDYPYVAVIHGKKRAIRLCRGCRKYLEDMLKRK